MATTTLDELIERTRIKANVLRSNFVLNPEIIVYLNEAGQQLRELIVTADDSYYQATQDYNTGAQPDNVEALPEDFWKMRGLDAFAGDSFRQTEVYAREFRNRFDAGLGYYFGGDGNSLVLCPPASAPQGNPWRLTYTPKPLPLALLVEGVTQSIAHDSDDEATVGGNFIFEQADFSAADVGGSLVVSGSGIGVDGTYSILAVVSAQEINVIPDPPASGGLGVGTVATIASLDTHTREFAIANPDSMQNGNLLLQNADFGPADVGAWITIDVGNDEIDGSYQITEFLGTTIVRVTPSVTGSFAGLVGTAALTRQPPGTRNELDLTEDNFAEYYSVRAAMVIARKKRQDSLVAQLAAERVEIEARIAALSRMRQSEPQQAPVLWGRRSRYADDWDV